MNPNSETFQFLQQQVFEIWPIERWLNAKILVAVSGGCDSVALLRLIVAIANHHKSDNSPPTNIVAAQFNHRTRSDADRDSEFVQRLCQSLGIPCHLGVADKVNFESGEESLRHQRYDFLTQTANRIGARYLLVGHHADDQIETILFRMFRGTGIRGLRGMQNSRLLQPGLTLVRPLLNIRKQTLLEFLAGFNQPHSNDPSNENQTFQRNWIRHTLLPSLNAQFENRIPQSILKLADQAAEIETYLDEVSQPYLDQHVELALESKSQATIQLEGLIDCSELVVKSVLRRIWDAMDWPQQSMGKSNWDQIADWIRSQGPKKQILPGKIQMDVTADTARFRRLEN